MRDAGRRRGGEGESGKKEEEEEEGKGGWKEWREERRARDRGKKNEISRVIFKGCTFVCSLPHDGKSKLDSIVRSGYV